MADAVPAQTESVPGPPRDTRKVVDATKRAAEASPVERVSKGAATKEFVPLANPGRVGMPGDARPRRAHIKKREADERAAKTGAAVEAVAAEAVEEVDSVES